MLAQVIAGIRTESDAPVMDLANFLSIRNEIEGVTINDAVLDYIMQIVRRTRETESIRFGASTRAAISIARAARAWAYLQERDYVTPDDVKIVAFDPQGGV